MQNPRILDLLAQGVKPMQVLTIVGCTPQYLKSLLEDIEFKTDLEKKQAEYFKEADEDVVLTTRYLSLEHKILNTIEQQIGTAELRDNIKALEVVAKRQEQAKNRSGGAGEGASRVVINNISLNLPAHAIPEYRLNSNKEVVAIGNTAMAPMTGNAVKALFDSIKSGEKVVQAA
jgi:tRNA A37 N6-isopentenylltransferase MiaA